MGESFKLFLFASLGGAIFYQIHIPLPWMLGPLVFTFVWKKIKGDPIYWPRPIRNTGLIVLGYTMGSPFTLEIGRQIVGQLPGMAFSTLITSVVSLLFGWLASIRTGVGLITGIIGSIPGGLTQMAVICEEVKGSNATVVTIMQTTRMLTVVCVVPLLALYGFAGKAVSVSTLTSCGNINPWTLAYFAIGSIISAELLRIIKFPSPYLVGPLFGTVILIITGHAAPHLPQYIVAVAQIAVGIQMGADIQIEDLEDWKSIVLYSFGGIIAVIAVSFGVDYALAKIYSIPISTAFIATAPGGMTEMGLTAMAVHADVTVVIAYQLFRLLSLLVIVMPAVKWVFTDH